MIPVRRAAIVVVTALAAMAGAAGAHDFWLVPNAFRVSTGDTVVVRGQTSSHFPVSESAVAVDRVADARIVWRGGSTRIESLSISGTSLVLKHRPQRPGHYGVYLAIRPRSLRESVAGFRRYLELEGAPEALARVDSAGALAGRDSITRRYAKYAKTYAQVGRGGAPVHARRAGHTIEFMPSRDPLRLRAGDRLRFTLLFNGRPLAGARVSAGGVRRAAHADSAVTVAPDTVVTTDSNGAGVVRLSSAGLWNVRTIHIAEAPGGSGADWDAHWATMVFPVSER